MHVIPLFAAAARAPPSTHGCDRTAEHPPRRSTACADTPSAISPDDWTSLFDAVVVQLRNTVAIRTGDVPDNHVHDEGRVRARVLECVAALEKLQAARP